MKYLKAGKYELCALTIIIFALLLRLLLLGLGWPPTNSDEATMGLMARHIAYNGEHPVYFYGQNYMGSIEAYLGAIFFHLFSPSLISLRLSVILLFALFLASMYLLTSLLYTKKLALAVLALLSLGSNSMFLRELYASGGSTQTLLFGSLSFVLASWLALSYNSAAAAHRVSPSEMETYSGSKRWLRLAAYAAWGLVVGLGLWSDLVVVPFFMMSALLLLLFCWRDMRDLRPWAPLCLLLGLVVGASPLLGYNMQAPGANTLATILGLFQGSTVQSPHTLSQLALGIRNTLQMSFPTATGDPSCPVAALTYSVDGSMQSQQCLALHAGWGLAYILLWSVAVYLTVRTLWKLKRERASGNMTGGELTPAELAPTVPAPVHRAPVLSAGKGRRRDVPTYRWFQWFERFTGERRVIVLHFARLFLLGSAGLALAAYAASSAPLGTPQSHARYLVGLLMVTPALLWPLWNWAFGKKETGGEETLPPLVENTVSQKPVRKPQALLSLGLLLLIAVAFLVGTLGIFKELPATQAADQQQNALINALIHIGATHIYTDYWTCDRIAFVSNEQIICGVINNHLQPSHNRDMHYYTIVSSDPHSAYALPIGDYNLPAVEQMVATHGGDRAFQRFVFDGYVVYQPR